MIIFVASSWRNINFESFKEALEKRGHQVYNWKDPKHAFHWRDINPDWQEWNSSEFISALNNDRCIIASTNDFDALKEADVGILLLPAGRSAHFEAGMMAGWGKPLCVLLDSKAPPDPELVYLNAEFTTDSFQQVYEWLDLVARRGG